MAVSRQNEFNDGTVLTETKLEGEFDNIYDNQASLGWPATATKDLDGNRLILDADGDTYIEATTDDRIDFVAGGVKRLEVSSSAPVFARAPILNGRFLIWQAGTSFPSPTTGDVMADGWRWGHTGGGAVTVDQNNGLRVTVTTADASIAASDQYRVYHQIEGYDIADLLYGTANAKTTTLTFTVTSDVTGTYCVAYRNSDKTRSYVQEFTISEAATAETKTLTFPGDTSGTWDSTNGRGLEINWALASGTDKQTTADSWQSGNYSATSSQANFMATLTNVFEIEDVQLDVGNATGPQPFEPLATTLLRAQRYRYVIDEPASGIAVAAGHATATNESFLLVKFPTEMVGTPTITETTGSFSVTDSGGTGVSVSSWGTHIVDSVSAVIVANVSSGLAAGNGTLLIGGSGSGKLVFIKNL